MNHRYWAVIGGLFAALAAPCAGAAGRPPAPDWNTQASISYLPASNLHGAAADASISDYRVRISRNLAFDSALTLSVGGGYALKHIESSPGAALPSDLHALTLETGLNYRLSDRSFASLKITPGFYSDFGDLGSDDLRMPLLALGGYTFENGISVIGGFLYRFGYHAAAFIPALGLTYQPNEQWRIDLVMPRPGVTYSASRQLRFSLAGDLASDEYQLKDRSHGAEVLRYSDYKLIGGVDYLPIPPVKISAAAGYAFERKFLFHDGPRQDVRLDGAPFLRLAIDYSW